MTENNRPECSIILPIYNQEKHIDFIVKSYEKALTNAGLRFEVLLVVNGSRDGSYLKAEKATEGKSNFRVFSLEEGGWGRAVKYGIQKSRGKYICYTNSARTDVLDLVMILNFALTNDEFVVKATRIVRDSIERRLGSVLYNLENRLLFRVPVWDVNGTPKVMPAKVAKKLNIMANGDTFDAELIMELGRMHIKFLEVPITFTRRIQGNSTTNISSALNMYFGLLRLWRKKRGKN